MMKRLTIVLVLLLAVVLLTGCGQKEPERFQVVGTEVNTPLPTQAVQVNVPAPAPGLPDYDDGSYDPASEEGGDEVEDLTIDDDALNNAPVIGVTPAPTVNSEYAGATPVVIDPINKPTATPVPPVSFTFDTYEASKLHVSFQAPVGWTVDDTLNDTYVLTNNTPGMDYDAFISVRTIAVTKDYSKNNLATEVRQMLSTVSADFASFSPSKTAERPMLGKTGVYADYTAVTQDGAKVAGRIHIVCINKTLYTLHMSYPRCYLNEYKENVYGKFRKSLKVTQ